MSLNLNTLPKPARYFPLERAQYEVAPGLRPLGADFGNGDADRKYFQFDREFAVARESKERCRAERLGKYHCFSPEPRLEPALVTSRVAFWIAETLLAEWPQYFQGKKSSDGSLSLNCALTGDSIRLDKNGGLEPGTRYVTALDALASQVQEDIAVITRYPDGANALSSIHLCSPSHWSAEDKIGKDFFAIHAPVPGIAKINAAASSFVDAMIHKGPYVRFVWGFGTDRRLNHHPEPPPGVDIQEWRGRSFAHREDGQSPFILRVERQVTIGLPEVSAAVFLIRVSFIDGEEIRTQPRERELLCGALRSMNEPSLKYKGLSTSLSPLLQWLES